MIFTIASAAICALRWLIISIWISVAASLNWVITPILLRLISMQQIHIIYSQRYRRRQSIWQKANTRKWDGRWADRHVPQLIARCAPGLVLSALIFQFSTEQSGQLKRVWEGPWSGILFSYVSGFRWAKRPSIEKSLEVVKDRERWRKEVAWWIPCRPADAQPPVAMYNTSRVYNTE